MSDNELLTLVREQRNKIPMTVPVEQVISRGRRVRAWRRIRALAAALAGAAAAAAAVTALLPAGGHPASQRPDADLTAWAVVRQPGGDLAVTIRQLFNPAGLQRKLRADGVPASVTFGPGHQNRSCQGYPASRALMNKVFPPVVNSPTAALVIRPSALPAGAGVYIDDLSNPYGYIGLQMGLVHTSMRCTGSRG